MQVTVEASYGQGGSKGYSSSDSESTSTGVSNNGGIEVSYEATSAGMIIGVVKCYKYENSKTPERVQFNAKVIDSNTILKLNCNQRHMAILSLSHTPLKLVSTKI